jgi:hypothetical protein
LVLTLCSCSGKPVRPTAKKNQYSAQVSGYKGQTRYEPGIFNRQPVSYNSYQTKGLRRTGPLLGLNFKKFFGSFRYNFNEAITDNFAAIIVVFAVILVIGFVIFQNRRSVRKGSYR